MRIRWNCGGGDTVTLTRRDRLEDVPDTHRAMITAAVATAFANPIAYFRDAAKRCRFRGLSQYLHAPVSTKQWQLRLHTNGYGSPGIAAFAFKTEGIMTAEISPPEPKSQLQNFPCEVAELYSYLDWMNWSVYGGAGGLERGSEKHSPISQLGLESKPALDLDQTYIWGTTGCGDMLVYAMKNRGGMLCHENGYVHLIGTAGETIDWMCNELLAGRKPEFSYREWLPK